MSSRVLITGAGGFIGSALVPAFIDAGWTVRAAARSRSRTPQVPGTAGLETVSLPDLAGPVDWRPLLEGVSHVVHLAGLAHASERIAPAVYTAVNATAVGGLAIAAREAGVERFVLMSSVRAQSGPVSASVLDETAVPMPTDAYGRSKLAGEMALAEAVAGSAVQPVVLRPVVVYGPGVKANMRTLARLARSPLPLPVERVTGRRSILSSINLVAAVLHASTRAACAGGTFLVADEPPLTLPQMLFAMRAGLARSGRVVPMPPRALAALAQLSGGGASWERLAGDLVVDAGRLRATGWQPLLSAEAGLYAWMQAEGRRH